MPLITSLSIGVDRALFALPFEERYHERCGAGMRFKGLLSCLAGAAVALSASRVGLLSKHPLHYSAGLVTYGLFFSEVQARCFKRWDVGFYEHWVLPASGQGILAEVWPRANLEVVRPALQGAVFVGLFLSIRNCMELAKALRYHPPDGNLLIYCGGQGLVALWGSSIIAFQQWVSDKYVHDFLQNS